MFATVALWPAPGLFRKLFPQALAIKGLGSFWGNPIQVNFISANASGASSHRQ